MNSQLNKVVGSFCFTVNCALALSTVLVLSASTAVAGGCAPGQPCWEQNNVRRKPRPAPIQRRVVEPVVQEEVIVEEAVFEEPIKSPSNSNLAVSGGINVFYFNCEDTAVAPSLMVDYQPDSDLPINLRLGVEGASIDGDQFAFTPQSNLFQDSLDLTFIRIPLSIEYVVETSEDTKAFFGIGPSLLILDGDADNSDIDVDETDVGLHLAVRVQKAVTDNIALSVEGGYLFADVDTEGEDFDIDGAYTGVHLVGMLN